MTDRSGPSFISSYEDPAARYERGILGAILLDPELFGYIDIPTTCFPTDAGRRVYQVMASLREEGKTVDELSLRVELARQNPVCQESDERFLVHAVSEVLTTVVTKPVFLQYVEELRRAAAARAASAAIEDALHASQSGAQKEMWEHLDKAQQWRHEYEKQRARNTIRTLADVPDVFDFSDDFEWIVDGLIPKRQITVMAATGGTGKSYLALSLAVAVAKGGTWLGRSVTKMPVLYLDRENDVGIVKHRLSKLAVGSVMVPVWGCWGADPPPNLNDWRLLEIAKEGTLIIVDSFIDFYDVQDESDAIQMKAAFAPIRALQRAGATLLVLHHANRNGEYRGSSAIRDIPDALIELKSLEAFDRDPGRAHLELRTVKLRAGAKPRFSIHANWINATFDVSESRDEHSDSGMRLAIRRALAAGPLSRQGIAAKVVGRHQTRNMVLDKYTGEDWVWEAGPRRSRIYSLIDHHPILSETDLPTPPLSPPKSGGQGMSGVAFPPPPGRVGDVG